MIAIVAFIAIVVMLAFISKIGEQKNKYGDEIVITNLNEETAGREKPSSSDVIDYIQSELLKIVNMNSEEEIKGRDITDATIREGTFVQEYDSDKDIYIVSFMVDIKSLSQSYQASYQWVKGDGLDEDIDEWGINVRCLPQDKLIYGDFGCQDMFSVMGNDDSIINFLPHSTLNYRITFNSAVDNGLNIVIYTTAADERANGETAIINYKQEALDWIRSVGFDPLDYVIDYSYNRASIY